MFEAPNTFLLIYYLFENVDTTFTGLIQWWQSLGGFPNCSKKGSRLTQSSVLTREKNHCKSQTPASDNLFRTFSTPLHTLSSCQQIPVFILYLIYTTPCIVLQSCSPWYEEQKWSLVQTFRTLHSSELRPHIFGVQQARSLCDHGQAT